MSQLVNLKTRKYTNQKEKTNKQTKNWEISTRSTKVREMKEKMGKGNGKDN